MSGSLYVWENSSNLDDGAIVDLPLYSTIFGLHEKIESIEEDKDAEDSSIHLVVPYFFFQCEKYDLLLPVLRNCCSLIDAFVYQLFCKVLFESKALF